jgi:hypothetical protein
MCVARQGATVDIELGPTTATDAHFPFSRFFGLWLLHEPAVTLVVDRDGKTLWRSEKSPGGPIAGEVSFDELMALTDVETPDEKLIRPPSAAERQQLRERKRALVQRFVNAVSYVDVQSWRPMLCEARAGHYLEPAVRGGTRWKEAWQALQDAHERAIDYDADGNVKQDDSVLPRATLRIEATSDRWTEHLSPGMGWDVYAFDSDAGMLL